MNGSVPRVFISYRREDTEWQSGHLYERLADELGEGNVFFDVDSVPIGTNVRDVIAGYISEADVLLVVIGSRWDPERLSRANDWVQVEIDEAMTQGVPIVPALIGDAEMPSPDGLPVRLQSLSGANAARLRPMPDFRNDVGKLIDAIREIGARAEVKRAAAKKTSARKAPTEETWTAEQAEIPKMVPQQPEVGTDPGLRDESDTPRDIGKWYFELISLASLVVRARLVVAALLGIGFIASSLSVIETSFSSHNFTNGSVPETYPDVLELPLVVLFGVTVAAGLLALSQNVPRFLTQQHFAVTAVCVTAISGVVAAFGAAEAKTPIPTIRNPDSFISTTFDEGFYMLLGGWTLLLLGSTASLVIARSRR